MFQNTHPAALPDSPSDFRWSQFRVDHPGEIVALLRLLRDRNVPVNLSAPGGSSLTTSLWTIDGARGRLSFSAGDGSPQLQALIDADEAAAVAYLDSVKLQFDLHDLVLVHSVRSTALQAEMPHELYRFQRRDAFRVRPGDRQAPQAVFRHPALPDMELTLRVLDVSSGGCALLVPDDVPPLEPGTRIGDVRIDLDVETGFAAMLTLHHVSSMQGSGDSQAGGVRIGCEWGPIGGTAGRALQRWIDQTQKRRRALPLG